MSEQSLQITVAAPMDVWYSGFSAAFSRDGVKSDVVLHDDGSTASDEPWDGIWVGESVGPSTASVELTLTGTNIDGAVKLFSGWIPTEGDSSAVALVVRAGEDGVPTAAIVASAWPDGIPDIRSEYRVAALLGVIVLVAGIAYFRFGGR